MTMIGFATYGDHAEFITDTSTYTLNVERLGRTTKHLTIAHLDAAVLTQGDTDFGVLTKLNTLTHAGEVSTFDELVENMPELLTELWQVRAGREGQTAPSASVAFLLGWSDTAQEFVAFVFPSDRDFKRMQVKGTWLMPMPWSYRPTGLEMRRLRIDLSYHPQVDEAIEAWRSKPAVSRPSSVEDWIQLAQEAREQRSMEVAGRVLVTGDVIHTRLGRGEVTTRRVHRFNDFGDELLWMLRGTKHPLAAYSPCYCDSGRPMVECCGSAAAAPA